VLVHQFDPTTDRLDEPHDLTLSVDREHRD